MKRFLGPALPAFSMAGVEHADAEQDGKRGRPSTGSLMKKFGTVIARSDVATRQSRRYWSHENRDCFAAPA